MKVDLGNGQALNPVSVYAPSGLSESPAFILVAHAEGDVDTLLGKRLQLTHEALCLTGIVTKIKLLAAVFEHLYEITITPRFAVLDSHFHARVFVSQTVPIIIREILQQHPACQYRMDKLIKSYPKRAHCAQYHESDFAFIRRLCAENQITYLTDAQDVLHFFDGQHGYQTRCLYPKDITRWAPRVSKEWDGVRVDITTYDTALCCGVRVEYEGYFVVSQVSHYWHSNVGYSNQCVLMPLQARLYPPKRYSKPIPAAPHPARITGERRVCFYWDERQSSSLPLPVLQSSAGDGWGAALYPKLNDKVWVDYDAGDIDRPIIIGQVLQKISGQFIGEPFGWRLQTFGVTHQVPEKLYFTAKHAISWLSGCDLMLSATEMQWNITKQVSMQAQSIQFQVGETVVGLSARGVRLRASRIEINCDAATVGET